MLSRKMLSEWQRSGWMTTRTTTMSDSIMIWYVARFIFIFPKLREYSKVAS